MEVYFFYLNSQLMIKLPNHCSKIIHLKNNILRNYNFNFSNMKIYYIENGIAIVPNDELNINSNLDYYLEVN